MALLPLVALAACSRGDEGSARADPRVLVLGIDGMDPRILRQLIESGRAPNFERLSREGSFKELATTAPPQSPVAWASFICGADPGTHQIFDFIHRDPDPPVGPAPLPFLSISTVEPPKRDWAIQLGRWRMPLFAATPVCLRRGRAFWDDLGEAGVESVLYRVPTVYPPPDPDGPVRCMCGMGTPDLLGTYGEFTFFTPDAPAGGRMVGGGQFARLRLERDCGRGVLSGPDNYLLAPDAHGAVPRLTASFDVARDPRADVVKIAIGDELLLLNRGEWSGWVPVAFETGIPGSWLLSAAGVPTAAPAMVRFYVKSVHPKLELYVTPLNIDPLSPATSVGSPGDFPADVAAASGRYYTTGIPEDTKALRAHALDEDEFLSQVGVLKAERFAQFRAALASFDRGFLFFYFGHTDQLAHIFWRDRDPGHPARDPEEARRYATVVEDAYVEMDGLVGEAMAALRDRDTLIVLSDHGFTSFRRGFNLNSWLFDNGYLAVSDPARRGDISYLAGVNWSKTRAYALGLNALYVNLAGRERSGFVRDGEERAKLLQELSEKLREVRDADGSRVIDTVYIMDQTYPGADRRIAPDIVVGYADNYRASWATAEGGLPPELLEDNHDRWSGDHCIAAHLVPGILVTNRKVTIDDPDLTDLAPTILGLFGIDPPPQMTGRALLPRSGTAP